MSHQREECADCGDANVALKYLGILLCWECWESRCQKVERREVVPVRVNLWKLRKQQKAKP